MKFLLLNTISTVFDLLSMLIVIRAIMSWFRPSGYNKLYYDVERAVHALTEPILAPIRNALPPVGPGIDFSPLVAILLLRVVEGLVRGILLRLI